MTTTTYSIVATHHYCAPTKDVSKPVLDGTDPQRPLEFATELAAQAWIDGHEDEIYYTSHNEYDRPTFEIVTCCPWEQAEMNNEGEA